MTRSIPHPVQAKAGTQGGIVEVLVTTTLIQIIATATMLGLTPIAPHAGQSFGISPHMIGYQISLIYVFGALGSAFTGSLVARAGPVRVEQLALLLFAAGLLGLATSNLWLAALASALIGIGYGVQNPASSQILSRIAPAHQRNMIFSIKQAGVPVGGVIASLGFPLLDRAIGWQAGFAIITLIPIGLCLYLNRHVAGDERPPANSSKNWLAALLADQKLIWRGPFRALSLLSLLYSSVQMSLSTFIVLMLVEERGWGLIAAAGVAGLVQLSGAFGRVFWGVASDRAGHGMAILALIGLICTLGLIALWNLATLPELVLIPILCLLGATASGWNGVAMAEMARLCDPGEASRVIGAVLVYTFIGVVIGPSSMAALYGEIGSYGHGLALFAVASGIGTVIAAISAARQPRHRL
jgi:MFS family permease